MDGMGWDGAMEMGWVPGKFPGFSRECILKNLIIQVFQVFQVELGVRVRSRNLTYCKALELESGSGSGIRNLTYCKALDPAKRYSRISYILIDSKIQVANQEISAHRVRSLFS
jgi:hypothetical protein